MRNTGSSYFCADRIDFITNLAVITNAVIKRVHIHTGPWLADRLLFALFLLARIINP